MPDVLVPFSPVLLCVTRLALWLYSAVQQWQDSVVCGKECCIRWCVTVTGGVDFCVMLPNGV